MELRRELLQKWILIVEDDSDIRDSISEILEIEGYQIAQASNGQEGLERLGSMASPSLILLDLMMPVKDGFQFREEQLADSRWAKIPVVVISADGQILDKQDRIKARDILRKPMEITALIDIVRKNCE